MVSGLSMRSSRFKVKVFSLDKGKYNFEKEEEYKRYLGDLYQVKALQSLIFLILVILTLLVIKIFFPEYMSSFQLIIGILGIGAVSYGLYSRKVEEVFSLSSTFWDYSITKGENIIQSDFQVALGAILSIISMLSSFF